MRFLHIFWYAASPAASGFFTGPVVQGPEVDWQYPASLVDSTPRFLSAKRSAVSSRREEIACVALAAQHNTRVCGPLCDPMGSSQVVLTLSGSPTVFYWYSRSGLQLQPGLQFVQRSDCRAADLAVFRRRKAFLLCKNPCGGTAVGMGSPPQSGIAAPAQRNFQRKFALRQVGSYKFVVPPTRERSKVRNNARQESTQYRAAPGCQRDRGPSVSGSVQRNLFQGVPLGNFFAEARHRASFRR